MHFSGGETQVIKVIRVQGGGGGGGYSGGGKLNNISIFF